MRTTITEDVGMCAGSASLTTITKRIIFCTALLLCFSFAKAQQPGPHYRQFNFNPYLFNPAYVGINNQVEASMAYRQQWAGFKDAPATAGVSLQLPQSNRVALGFSMFTDRQVLLQHSNMMATVGYVLPIARNQTIRFAMSGGVGLNKLNLSAAEMTTNDPVIMRAQGTNYYVDGNFGMVYTFEGLKIGFALTDFFKSDPFNAETFNQFKMSNLRNRLFSASYRFDVGRLKDIALEPYAIYRQTADGVQDYWEVATVAHFRDKIWTGVSYNQNKGLGLTFGMNVKDKFRFGYSYDFAAFGSNISGGAHELHLGIRLASKKVTSQARNGSVHSGKQLANAIPMKADPKESQVLEEPKSEVEDDRGTHQSRLAENDPPVINTTTAEPATPEADTKVEKNTATKTPAKAATPKTRESFAMTSGHHYVVVGVYRNLSGAMMFAKQTKAKGYPANVVLNPKNNFYYVYIHSGTELSEARQKRNAFRMKNLFKEAWLFSHE